MQVFLHIYTPVYYSNIPEVSFCMFDCCFAALIILHGMLLLNASPPPLLLVCPFMVPQKCITLAHVIIFYGTFKVLTFFPAYYFSATGKEGRQWRLIVVIARRRMGMLQRLQLIINRTICKSNKKVVLWSIPSLIKQSSTTSTTRITMQQQQQQQHPMSSSLVSILYIALLLSVSSSL